MALGTGSFQPKALMEVGTTPEGCGDVPEKRSVFLSFFVAFESMAPIFAIA
jgi:hypothetical protein